MEKPDFTYPVLSVVMPIFNSASYVQNSIQSILSQTLHNFELIVIDDGSDDNSIDKILEFKDTRIKLHQNNHDFIGSLNMGLNLAQGKYIVRMDSDDIMLPNRLAVQYKFMEENPIVDVCGTWAKCFGSRDSEIRTAQHHKDIVNQMLFHNTLINPSTIIRNKTLQQFKLQYNKDYLYAEDYKLWVDLIMQGCKFANIPDTLLNYYCGDSQVTKKHYGEMMSVAKKIQVEYAEYVMNLLAEINEDSWIFMDKLNVLLGSDLISTNSFFNILSSYYNDYLISNHE